MDLPYIISKPAKLENLETFLNYIQEIETELDLDSGLVNKIHLVLEEVLVNIMKYAYPAPGNQDNNHNISIKCGIQNQDSFCMQIKDQGLAFNPLETKDPDIHEDMEKRPIGGLGIYLVKQMADQVEYKRENQTNIITICFKKQTL